MVDLETIIRGHRPKHHSREVRPSQLSGAVATSSEIPDLFFDEILVRFKLTRIEIIVQMYLYRKVWARPNLYKKYGISPLLSYTEMSNQSGLDLDEIYHALRKLEEYQFISTIRSGQYFVRRYFTKALDETYGQNYDDFDF